jgi:autotransporter-associated beta strand protein
MKRLRLWAAAALALGVAGSAPGATEYRWLGTLDSDWTLPGNWNAGSIGPTGGTSDSRLSVYNSGGSPLFYTAAQGDTVYAGTSARSLVIGSGGTGVLYITGGSFESRGSQDDVFGNGENPGLLVVDGGTFVKTNGNNLVLALSSVGGGWGAIRVTNGTALIRSMVSQNIRNQIVVAGGVLDLGQLTASAMMTNILNGGTLKVLTDQVAWLPANSFNLVGDNGVTIDTRAFDAGIYGALASNSVAGGLTVRGTGNLNLHAANTYAGQTLVEQGRLVLRHNDAVAGTSGIVVSNNAYLGIGNGITAGAGRTVTIYGQYSDSSGALRVRDGSGTWAGDVMLGQNNTRIGASGGAQSLTIGGVIDDGANTFNLAIRTVDNASEVVLSGANTYGGNTAVVVGGLRLAGADDRLPVGTLLEIGNGSNVGTARFDLGGFNQTLGGLSGLGTSMSIAITNSGATASTLTIDQAANRTYRGSIDGDVNLVKSGAGTLTLSGSFNSTGSVHVTGGILAFTGSASVAASVLQVDAGAKLVATNRTSTLQLGSGQVLKGTGTFVGGLITDSGAAVAPGASPGTLTVEGDLTMNAGSSLAIELNGTGAGQYDVLALAGGLLTLNGAALDVTLGYTPTPYVDAFTIVSGLGALPAGTFSGKPDGGAFQVGSTWMEIDYTPTSVILSVIPEPSTLGALGLAVVLAALFRRR